jgi:hypothetical protein
MGRKFVIIKRVTKPVGICTDGVFTIAVFNLQVKCSLEPRDLSDSKYRTPYSVFENILRPRTKHVKSRLSPHGHISLLNKISRSSKFLGI